MQNLPEESSPRIVVLATGGTIAGTAASPGDNLGYRAAQLGVDALIAAVPSLQQVALEAEQVAQLDSKDMDFVTWRRLAQRVAHHLTRAEVQGVVITHGTDTLEETAFFLQRLLAPAKPVVLTAAMRPATAMAADGPRNLADAVAVAREPGARGVLVVVAGSVWSGLEVRKVHTYRLDAFAGGDAGVIARVEEERVRRFREWPHDATATAPGLACIEREPADWPRVEIVLNHVGADGGIVRALLRDGVQGLVVAGTGNATISQALSAALDEARSAGVPVVLATRCAAGPVRAAAGPDEAHETTAVQARVDLLLDLLAGSPRR